MCLTPINPYFNSISPASAQSALGRRDWTCPKKATVTDLARLINQEHENLYGEVGRQELFDWNVGVSSETSDAMNTTLNSANDLINKLNGMTDLIGPLANNINTHLGSSANAVKDIADSIAPQATAVKEFLDKLKSNWAPLILNIGYLPLARDWKDLALPSLNIFHLLGVHEEIYKRFSPQEIGRCESFEHSTNLLLLFMTSFMKMSPSGILNGINLSRDVRELEALNKILSMFTNVCSEWGFDISEKAKLIREIKEITSDLFRQMPNFEYVANFQPYKFQDPVYCTDFDKLYSAYNKLKLSLTNSVLIDLKGHPINNEINSLGIRMLKLKNQVDKAKLSSNCRPVTAGYLFVGDKGIGKSEISLKLLQMIKENKRSSLLFKKLTQTQIWHWNTSDKYHQGCYDQLLTYIEDFNQRTDCVDHADLFGMLSSAPFMTRQAELSEKGIFFKSLLCIASANKWIRKSTTINDISALQSRFKVVRCKGSNLRSKALKVRDPTFSFLDMTLFDGSDYNDNVPDSKGQKVDLDTIFNIMLDDIEAKYKYFQDVLQENGKIQAGEEEEEEFISCENNFNEDLQSLRSGSIGDALNLLDQQEIQLAGSLEEFSKQLHMQKFLDDIGPDIDSDRSLLNPEFVEGLKQFQQLNSPSIGDSIEMESYCESRVGSDYEKDACKKLANSVGSVKEMRELGDFAHSQAVSSSSESVKSFNVSVKSYKKAIEKVDPEDLADTWFYRETGELIHNADDKIGFLEYLKRAAKFADIKIYKMIKYFSSNQIRSVPLNNEDLLLFLEDIEKKDMMLYTNLINQIEKFNLSLSMPTSRALHFLHLRGVLPSSRYLLEVQVGMKIMQWFGTELKYVKAEHPLPQSSEEIVNKDSWISSLNVLCYDSPTLRLLCAGVGLAAAGVAYVFSAPLAALAVTVTSFLCMGKLGASDWLSMSLYLLRNTAALVTIGALLAGIVMLIINAYKKSKTNDLCPSCREDVIGSSIDELIQEHCKIFCTAEHCSDCQDLKRLSKGWCNMCSIGECKGNCCHEIWIMNEDSLRDKANKIAARLDNMGAIEDESGVRTQKNNKNVIRPRLKKSSRTARLQLAYGRRDVEVNKKPADKKLQMGPGRIELMDENSRNLMTSLVQKNYVKVQRTCIGNDKKAFLFGIGYKNYVVCPRHIKADGTDKYTYSFVRRIDHRKFEDVATPLTFVSEIPQFDISLWKFEGAKFNEKLEDHLMTETVYETKMSRSIEAYQWIPTNETVFGVRVDFHASEITHPVEGGGTVTYAKNLIVRCMYTTPPATSYGDCGGVILAADTTFDKKVLGFHVMGKDSSAVSIPLYSEILYELIAKDKTEIGKVQLQDKLYPVYNVNSTDYPIIDLENIITHAYEEPVYVPPGNFEYLGEIQYDNPVKRTVLRKSPFHKYFEETKRPAILDEKLLNEEQKAKLITNGNGKVDILVSRSAAFGKDQVKISKEDHIFLNEVTDELIEYYVDLIDEDVGPCDWDEAVGGNPNDIDSHPLESATSAGIGWNRFGKQKLKKGNYFEFANGQKVFNSEPHTLKLRQTLDDIEDLAEAGYRTLQIDKNCLKDEMRPIDKVWKPRLFKARPLTSVLLKRKYFLRFKVAIKRLGLAACHAVGVDELSTNWDKIYYHLLEYGDEGFDADFGGFDSNQLREFQKYVAKIKKGIITRVQIKLGKPLTERDLAVIDVLLDESINSISANKSSVYVDEHGNASGDPETTPDNVWMNLLYHVYAHWKITGKRSFAAFLANVRVVFFGDDLIIVPKKGSGFTFDAVQKVMHDLGQDYTSGDKSEHGSMKPITEMTFLKRHFKPVSPTVVLAPLDKESIESRFLWTEVDLYDYRTHAEVISRGLIEAAMHGPDYYNKVRGKIQRGLTALNWRGLPAFAGLCQCYSDVYASIIEIKRGGSL